jgi:glyoxylase-like metal-dependent hydrolase (beta-lactamase superfamily II)
MGAQAAPQQSISIGDIRITNLPDGEGHIVATGMFPASTEEAWQAHQQFLDDDGRLVTNIAGFLIQTGDRNILVDLGFGDHTAEWPDFAVFTGGRLLDSLKQAGVSPAEVDTVVYTHMHLDHTGWTTTGENLTFPNARHIAAAAEWAHWQEPDQSGVGPNAEAVLAPLSSHIEQVGDGDVIAPGVNVLATPGHTPGHQSIVVSSGTDRAVILGDVINCPVQIAEPEWSVLFDVDPALARRTRDSLLAELEGSSTIVSGSHFTESVFGRVVPGQGQRLWQFGL